MQQITVFTLLTLSLSWLFEGYLILNGGVKNFGLLGLIVLMWIPGLISLIYRKISGIGFSDIGWKLGPRRNYILAIALPLTLALLTNLLSVPFGLRIFSPLALSALEERTALIIISLVLGFVGALGEEIGWRGFLLPKLFQAKVRHPYIASGLIWAIWHLPLVTLGGILHPELAIADRWRLYVVSLLNWHCYWNCSHEVGQCLDCDCHSHRPQFFLSIGHSVSSLF